MSITPSTEVAIPEAQQLSRAEQAERDLVDGWTGVVGDIFKLADKIAWTEFVPKAYRENMPAVAAAILTGRELGLGPMMALRHVQVVEGSPGLSAEYKRARVLSAGHEFTVVEWDDRHCTVKGRRRGSTEPPLVVTYTMDDAKRAGLVKDRSGWVRRPRRMLFARAGTDLCDALFSDVVNGLPTAELLEEDADADRLPDLPPQNGQRPAGRVTVGEVIGRRPADDTQDAQPDQPSEKPAAAALTDDDTAAEDKPGSASDDQLTRLHTVFTGLGFDTRGDRELKLQIAEAMTGRPLDGPWNGRSSKNLSFTEAGKLVDTLGGFEDRAALIAYMAERAEADQAQDGGDPS